MAEQDAIRCMQLPLHGLSLLVPNSAVAEIIGYSAPQQAGQAEPWLQGKISWRGVMVPIVSFEHLCQMEAVEPGPRSRFAVLYNAQPDNQDVPYFGIILQDIPRGYLAQQERMLASFQHAECDYLAGQADPLIEGLMVPDLDAVLASVRQAGQA